MKFVYDCGSYEKPGDGPVSCTCTPEPEELGLECPQCVFGVYSPVDVQEQRFKKIEFVWVSEKEREKRLLKWESENMDG